MQERVQEAESNGATGEEKAKAGPTKPNRQSNRQARGKSGRFERQNGAEVDTDLSPRTLLTRLEQQSGQLGILRSKLDETRKLAAREREAAQSAPAGRGGARGLARHGQRPGGAAPPPARPAEGARAQVTPRPVQAGPVALTIWVQVKNAALRSSSLRRMRTSQT